MEVQFRDIFFVPKALELFHVTKFVEKHFQCCFAMALPGPESRNLGEKCNF